MAGLLPASSVTDTSALHSSSIQALAPDAVALMDAFDHDDFTLDSAVGTSFYLLSSAAHLLLRFF